MDTEYNQYVPTRSELWRTLPFAAGFVFFKISTAGIVSFLVVYSYIVSKDVTESNCTYFGSRLFLSLLRWTLLGRCRVVGVGDAGAAARCFHLLVGLYRSLGWMANTLFRL